MSSSKPARRGCRSPRAALQLAVVAFAFVAGLIAASANELSRCLEDCIGLPMACADACRRDGSGRRSLAVRMVDAFCALAVANDQKQPVTRRQLSLSFTGHSQGHSLDHAADAAGIMSQEAAEHLLPRRGLQQSDEGASVLASTLLGFDGIVTGSTLSPSPPPPPPFDPTADPSTIVWPPERCPVPPGTPLIIAGQGGSGTRGVRRNPQKQLLLAVAPSHARSRLASPQRWQPDTNHCDDAAAGNVVRTSNSACC